MERLTEKTSVCMFILQCRTATSCWHRSFKTNVGTAHSFRPLKHTRQNPPNGNVRCSIRPTPILRLGEVNIPSLIPHKASLRPSLHEKTHLCGCAKPLGLRTRFWVTRFDDRSNIRQASDAMQAAQRACTPCLMFFGLAPNGRSRRVFPAGRIGRLKTERGICGCSLG